MISTKASTLPLNRAATLYHLGTERFKTARLSFVTVRPASPTESPLATLLYGILRRGSRQYPRLALLNRRLDELYGTTLTIRNYLHGDNHIVSFTAEMPEDCYLPIDGEASLLSGVMDVLAELILHPLLDENGLLRAEAVAAEKLSLCDSLRAIRNDTRAYAGNRFRQLLCPDEPYGLSVGGTVPGVEAVTPADVTEHWRRHLAAISCHIFYVGRADAAAVQSAWNRSFEGWNPAPLAIPVTQPHRSPATPHREEEELPVAQGKLCIGWSLGENYGTLPDPDRIAALYVGNEIFGVMQSSLLFRHVREELGLCYECESALDMTKGILWVSCGIHPDHRDRAETAIRAVFDRLQCGEVPAADIELAKLSLVNSYRQIEDSPGAMESFCTRRLLDHTTGEPEEFIRCILAVTPKRMTEALQGFRPDTVYFLKGTSEDEED